MNFEQPPPYPGPGPTAPGYPPQGYPAPGPPPQGYPVNMEQPNPAYPNYGAGAMGPGGPYPGPGGPYPGPGGPYQGQGYPGQPQFGWQGGPPPGPMYGEAPKNTVYVVEDRRRDDTGDTCLTACWTALCCCCLWDMLT